MSPETIYTVKCLAVIAGGWNLTAGTTWFVRVQPPCHVAPAWAESPQPARWLTLPRKQCLLRPQDSQPIPRLWGFLWNSYWQFTPITSQICGVCKPLDFFAKFTFIHASPCLNKGWKKMGFRGSMNFWKSYALFCVDGQFFVGKGLHWFLNIISQCNVAPGELFSLPSLWKMRIILDFTPCIWMIQWENTCKLPSTVSITFNKC